MDGGRKVKIAVIGAGQRGMVYAGYMADNYNEEIVAVVEPHEIRRNIAKEKFDIPSENVFKNSDDFFAKGKLADVVIIASMDRDHYGQVMKALDCGYDILLEKPISPDPEECLRIEKKANECGRKVTVCHVLRYTNFFTEIKRIIDSGEIGKVMTIQHAENIGNFHMAHSFVRGNWRNSDESSPIIMQKSCHDMDILVWLAGSGAKRVSSFGSLDYFKEENAPEGSSARCLDCEKASVCRFDAKKAYPEVAGRWPATVLTSDQSEEGILKALKEGPYGRCVYRCDNNVCDHQVSIIEFENGVTATFHLSGFTNKIHRTIKVMCEDGDIYGDDADNTIIVTKYAPNVKYENESRKFDTDAGKGGHGGGDFGIVKDFIEGLRSDSSDSRSSIDRSVESHIMAYAAEKSRVENKVVVIKDLKEELMTNES